MSSEMIWVFCIFIPPPLQSLQLTEAIQGKKQPPISQRSRTRTFELVTPGGGSSGGDGGGDTTSDQEIVSDSESATEQQSISV